MKDLLEQALDNEHIEMIVWLLQNDKRLLNHELSDGTTCKDRLMRLKLYTRVLSKLFWLADTWYIFLCVI